MSSLQVLVHYDPTKKITLSCDASSYGLGCVLNHNILPGVNRPIAYASRTLTPSEKNYSQIDRETCAVIFAVTN